MQDFSDGVATSVTELHILIASIDHRAGYLLGRFRQGRAVDAMFMMMLSPFVFVITFSSQVFCSLGGAFPLFVD